MCVCVCGGFAECVLFGWRQVLLLLVLVQHLRQQIVHRLEHLHRGAGGQVQVVVHVVVRNAAIGAHQTAVNRHHLHVGQAAAALRQQPVHVGDALTAAVRLLASRQQRLCRPG